MTPRNDSKLHPVFPLRAGMALLLFVTLSGCRGGGGNTPANPANGGKAVPVASTPAAPPQPAPLPPGGLKGIYLTGWSAGYRPAMDRLLGLVDRTELNAMVIDVKDDGEIAYDVDVPLAHETHSKLPAGKKKILCRMYKVDKLIATLNAHNIFPIARIACFRDTPMAEMHPEMAVQDANGKVWYGRKRAWLNPYSKAAWDYNVDIALDALKHGFKEIQFDYVRFPTDGDMSKMRFPGKPKDGKREDQIAAFLSYAREKIKAAGGWFSADIFGLTSLVKDDEGIGQKFSKVAEKMDYLCPMVYPSHYHHREYGVPIPDAEPYKIIFLSVGDAKKKLADVKTCKLRPWLQNFNLNGYKYGTAEIKAQIKALKDLGITEYLLWDARCKFNGTEAAVAKDTPPRVAEAPKETPPAKSDKGDTQ